MRRGGGVLRVEERIGGDCFRMRRFSSSIGCEGRGQKDNEKIKSEQFCALATQAGGTEKVSCHSHELTKMSTASRKRKATPTSSASPSASKKALTNEGKVIAAEAETPEQKLRAKKAAFISKITKIQAQGVKGLVKSIETYIQCPSAWEFQIHGQARKYTGFRHMADKGLRTRIQGPPMVVKATNAGPLGISSFVTGKDGDLAAMDEAGKGHVEDIRADANKYLSSTTTSFDLVPVAQAIKSSHPLLLEQQASMRKFCATFATQYAEFMFPNRHHHKKFEDSANMTKEQFVAKFGSSGTHTSPVRNTVYSKMIEDNMNNTEGGPPKQMTIPLFDMKAQTEEYYRFQCGVFKRIFKGKDTKKRSKKVVQTHIETLLPQTNQYAIEDGFRLQAPGYSQANRYMRDGHVAQKMQPLPVDEAHICKGDLVAPIFVITMAISGSGKVCGIKFEVEQLHILERNFIPEWNNQSASEYVSTNDDLKEAGISLEEARQFGLIADASAKLLTNNSTPAITNDGCDSDGDDDDNDANESE